MSLVYDKDNREYTKPSRYQILRVLHESTDITKYLETYNNTKIPESGDDTWHVVTLDEVDRLDIISNNYYGTPVYWWAIALANDYIDPFVVNEGEMIRIPSLTSLSDYKNEILVRRGK